MQKSLYILALLSRTSPFQILTKSYRTKNSRKGKPSGNMECISHRNETHATDRGIVTFEKQNACGNCSRFH